MEGETVSDILRIATIEDYERVLAELGQARAAAAAMRQALLSLKARIHFVHAPGEPMQFLSGKGMVPDWSDAIAKLESALAAGAGRELLAELERLRAENKTLLVSRDEWKRAGGQTAETRDRLRRRVAELEKKLADIHHVMGKAGIWSVDCVCHERFAEINTIMLAEPAAEGPKEGA